MHDTWCATTLAYGWKISVALATNNALELSQKPIRAKVVVSAAGDRDCQAPDCGA
jgi:hypothetical protein